MHLQSVESETPVRFLSLMQIFRKDQLALHDVMHLARSNTLIVLHNATSTIQEVPLMMELRRFKLQPLAARSPCRSSVWQRGPHRIHLLHEDCLIKSSCHLFIKAPRCRQLMDILTLNRIAVELGLPLICKDILENV